MEYDVIFISAEDYVDHPFCGVAILKHLLEDNGYSVGIISKPDWSSDDDFTKLGTPRLFFGVTSGSIDSMLNNYTPLKKKRNADEYANYNEMPDRAINVYCNKLKQLFKGIPIVIGGIEASMRRFAHFDYWQNRVRKGLLLDTRADVLVYGNGEKQILEIANRLNSDAKKKDLFGIEGTCVMSKKLPEDVVIVPSFDDVKGEDEQSKKEFCKMQTLFSIKRNVAQLHDKKYVVQFKFPTYLPSDIDQYYSYPYSRIVPSESLLKPMQFSVVTHRGCVGNCNFCSITLHQGKDIISRSKESIVNEVKSLVNHPDFDGEICDLGGPSANMYGMDCGICDGNCISCNKLDKSHDKLLDLLRTVREIPGVNEVNVRSGIRYDLALHSPTYVEEIAKHHIRSYLMVAPEHFSNTVCKLMNKDNSSFDEFRSLFNKVSKGKILRYYFMVGHPGCSVDENKTLQLKASILGNNESTQVFTPTPMTVSTCMYWTGMNPYTLEKIYVPYSYKEKKKQKNMIV